MNRPLIITIGIVLLLLMVGLWVYLLAYGAPEKPREVFSNLGFLSQTTQETPRVIDPYQEQNPGVQLSLGGAPLQQLTTRAVAGFAFVGDTERALRYIERGTGHAYEIDLTTGTETQISVTTLAQTTEAVFGPNVASVVLTSYNGYEKEHTIGVFENGELMLTSLPEGTDNIAYENEDTILFSREENGQTIGYAYTISKNTTAQIARIPFTASTLVWGNTINGIYAYPKPTDEFESSVYKVNNTLTPLGEARKGSVAIAEDTFVVVTSENDDLYTATAYLDGTAYAQPIAMLKEKCAFVTGTAAAYCAAPFGIPSVHTVMDEYKGIVTEGDNLWYVDLYGSEATTIAKLSILSGRTIVADTVSLHHDGTLLLLRNKLDGALWLYRITPSE